MIGKAAGTPRKLWVELTSKCPLDCVFCSRRTLHGIGRHMPYGTFASLVSQVADPRAFLLNYSGESTAYPELIPAIRLARSTGALVELVSALVCVPESMLRELAESGLNRLTVSVHAASEEEFAGIYRYGSFAVLRARLLKFLELCREVANPPIVDLAFVAMERNLEELSGVAAFAHSAGLHAISIFPVIRRDGIPVAFPAELTASGNHRPDFKAKVLAAIGRAREEWPAISYAVCNPAFLPESACIGEVPGPFPGDLPAGARIHSCEQDPWETAHVLANGDVVACEVLDKIPLGNLARQSLAEIWNGEAYRRFRERYYEAAVPECRLCPWKRAYLPGPVRSEIIGARGRSAQLLEGWHEPAGEPHIWSSQSATAVLAGRSPEGGLYISGVLPPGVGDSSNELAIRANRREIGNIVNAGREMMSFHEEFRAGDPVAKTWLLEFRTRAMYRPSERGSGTDQRDLGFALIALASKAWVDPDEVEQRMEQLRPLAERIELADRVAAIVAPWLRRRPRRIPAAPAPGLSVVIPEWDNVEELSACLDGLEAALAHWAEPAETIVVVNGSPRAMYRSLAGTHPAVKWRFYPRPLGFSGAIAAGLRHVRFDWVYLLNSDVVLDPRALEMAGNCRRPAVFAVASQIVLKDATRFRDETNWTRLFLEDGLATIHDLIPRSGEPVEGFYAGGGASLFQTRLLRRFLAPAVYAPFYWEDVEWGWRARKSGCRVLFCPNSIARHSRRSTIERHYGPAEVELVLTRNRLLFQLRNLSGADSKRAIEEIARSPGSIAEYFHDPRVLWRIVQGRMWNRAAEIGDAEVLKV